jgi:hypothetical protein
MIIHPSLLGEVRPEEHVLRIWKRARKTGSAAATRNTVRKAPGTIVAPGNVSEPFHHSLTKTDNENGRVTNHRQDNDSLAPDCSNCELE